MEKKEDLRIKKTKKALQNTIIKLLSKKSFEEIKVSEICDESYINRTTFYAHYKDKYELFNDTIKSLKTDLTDNLSKNKEIKSSLDYIMKLLDIYLDHIEENKEVYLPILKHNKNGIIMDMIFNTLEKDLTEKTSNYYDIVNLNIPIELIIKFYVGGIFYVGIEWLNNSNKYSKDEIQNHLKTIIANGIGNEK